MTRDPRIDAYIAARADFARPILEHIRRILHEAVPGVEETIKWGMPHFTHEGRILAAMGAFKGHATLALRNGSELLGEAAPQSEAMGHFGRLASIADLPAEDALKELVRKAAAAETAPKARAKPAAKPVPGTPADLSAALDSNPAARAAFDGFPPGARREYVEWILDAKRPETRGKRIAQAAAWISEGKKRNWKYEKC
jgi:uncharacterized protein YdeI (YjbR/CyaY-like superfamily)